MRLLPTLFAPTRTDLPFEVLRILVLFVHLDILQSPRLLDSSVATFSTMASLAVYLSATVLFAQSSFAFNCSISPIYVDIHKRAVHDSEVFQYGSFIGVGTPAQNHSLWPSLTQNQTSFGARTFCDGNSTLRDCDTSTGGFFESQLSTT